MHRGAAAASLAILALAPASVAAPSMAIGAAEDTAKQADPVAAKAKMELARLAGMDAVRLTAIWRPGQTAPSDGERLVLGNAIAAAQLTGIRVYLSVYNSGSRTTPLTPAARSEFAQLAASLAREFPYVKDFIIGNEPNLNRFWMPQFGLDGSDVAAPAYLSLLARTYDALKAVDPGISVIGGSVSPRGVDRPGTGRDTHSPTTFIPDMGAAYRASGRRRPVMDAFAFHPYTDSSRQPPTITHPRSTTVSLADYGKLVGLLRPAFDGTAQAGSTLPIVYSEFGVQSEIPPAKRLLYANHGARAAADAVPEAVQGAYYRQALALAYCQPTATAFLIFHVSDEADLDRWQSGLYYADDTPKSSLRAFQQAVADVRAGTIAECGSDGGPARERRIRLPEPWRGRPDPRR